MDVRTAADLQRRYQRAGAGAASRAVRDCDEALIAARLPELVGLAVDVYMAVSADAYQEATDAMALVNRAVGVAMARAFASQDDIDWAVVRAAEREAERCQRAWKSAYDRLMAAQS